MSLVRGISRIAVLVAAVLATRASTSPRTAFAAPPADADARRAFAALDAEHRWMRLVADDVAPAGWIASLAAARDVESLSWLAITMRTGEALDALERLDAPTWIRCGVWRLEAVDSHAKDAARAFLADRRPGAVLDWLERHPEAATGPAAALLRVLREREPPLPREDATKYAPPLDPATVLAPLSPPAKVDVLGDAEAPRAGVVYVHQVVRAIDAWASSTLRAAPWSDRIVALLRHGHPSIRRAAALACAHLPPAAIPAATLDALVDDAREPADVRAAAALAASYAPGTKPWLRLHALATDRSHPAWSAAVSRLGDVGDEFTVAHLVALAPSGGSAQDRALEADTLARIRARLAAEDAEAFAARIPEILGRAAAAAVATDRSARALALSAAATIGPRRAEPGVRPALEALRDGPPADALAARVAVYARRLLADEPLASDLR